MYPSSGECELSILIFRRACYEDFIAVYTGDPSFRMSPSAWWLQLI